MKHSLRDRSLKALFYSLTTLITIGLSAPLSAAETEKGTTCTVITGETVAQRTNNIYSNDCYIEMEGIRFFPGAYDDEGLLGYMFNTSDEFSSAPAIESTALGSLGNFTAKKASGINDPADCSNATYIGGEMKIFPATGYCLRMLLTTGYDLYMYVYLDDSGTFATGSIFTLPSKNISGNWTAEGYTCKGQASSGQSVKIEEKGEVFIGFKLTGDDCMPVGYATFRWDSTRDICQLIELTNPANQTQSMTFNACTLEYTDKDHFKIVLPQRDNYSFSFQKESALPSFNGFDSLIGTWSREYECNGQRSMQRLKIEKNEVVFTAVKLDGNDCMPAGYMQFYFDSSLNVCQWIGADNSLYGCSIHNNDAAGWFKISFPENEERKAMTFRKIAGVSSNPTKVLENLDIQIPYAEYQISPTQTRTIKGNLQFVPTADGKEMWKLSDSEFID